VQRAGHPPDIPQSQHLKTRRLSEADLPVLLSNLGLRPYALNHEVHSTQRSTPDGYKNRTVRKVRARVVM
jgi:hypothetical protein